MTDFDIQIDESKRVVTFQAEEGNMQSAAAE